MRLLPELVGLEEGNRGDEVRLAIEQERVHVGEIRLDDGVVALVLEPVLPQHRPYADIGAGADHVGRKHLALQVLDSLHRPVVQHVVVGREIARHAVLDLAGDDAEIAHVAVLDGKGQGRIGQLRDIEIARGERRRHLRAAGETDGLDRVGRAEMPRELGLGEQDRRQRGRHGDPRHPDFEWLRRCSRRRKREREASEPSRQLLSAMPSPFLPFLVAGAGTTSSTPISSSRPPR